MPLRKSLVAVIVIVPLRVTKRTSISEDLHNLDRQIGVEVDRKLVRLCKIQGCGWGWSYPVGRSRVLFVVVDVHD